MITYPERFIISKKNTAEVSAKPLSELVILANKSLPDGEEINRIDIYPSKDRTWVFRGMKLDKKKIWYSENTVYHKRIYIDPYLAKVQYVEDSKFEFFQVVLQIHRTLLLGSVGGTIVGVSTIILLILCFSGLILWWPKRWKKKMVKKAVWVDFLVKWKRLVYDFHNVLGFQSLIFAIIIAFFGLTFSFPALNEVISKLLNGNGQVKESTLDQHVRNTIKVSPNNLLNESLVGSLAFHPEADMISVRLRDPEKDHDVRVRLEKDKTSAFKWYYFDQKTGKINKIRSSDNLANGDYITSKNYDLHTGGIGGYHTKILAFLVSLICASLPVTGTIVWWNKRPKKGRKLKNVV